MSVEELERRQEVYDNLKQHIVASQKDYRAQQEMITVGYMGVPDGVKGSPFYPCRIVSVQVAKGHALVEFRNRERRWVSLQMLVSREHEQILRQAFEDLRAYVASEQGQQASFEQQCSRYQELGWEYNEAVRYIQRY